jgi:hypothetical protein
MKFINTILTPVVKISRFSIGSLLLTMPFLLTPSCMEPCDGDSFFEWFAFDYVILDPETNENFFNNQNPDYTYQNFKVYDQEGNECDKGVITFFSFGDSRYNEVEAAIRAPLTKYYVFSYNDYDKDTLKVTVKGTYSDRCAYQIIEYVKVYYNNKVIYYMLYKDDGEDVKIYKEI